MGIYTFILCVLIAENQMQKGTKVKYSKCAATNRGYEGIIISDEEITGETRRDCSGNVIIAQTVGSKM